MQTLVKVALRNSRNIFPVALLLFLISCKDVQQDSFIFPNGDKYIGQFTDGMMTGHGTKAYSNGDIYVGQFKDGLRHGQGTFTLKDGDKYIGEWQSDIPNGKGEVIETNGEGLKGQWKSGKPQGPCEMTFMHGVTGKGGWDDGKPSGDWELKYPDGRTYIGECTQAVDPSCSIRMAKDQLGALVRVVDRVLLVVNCRKNEGLRSRLIEQ